MIVSFAAFLVIWNNKQGQATPELHLRMAGWLGDGWRERGTRLLLQAFRGSGKSTIAGLYCAWLLYAKPDTRILVLAAETELARKMVRNVLRILERHPLTAGLRPEVPGEWGGERFTVARKAELRDPSMLARGISANLTGSRADIIICDDVEVPNTCGTTEKRESLRTRLRELEFILVPGGTLLYLGTPHNWHSIYAGEARDEIGEERPFLDGYRRLSIPVVNERGESAWPSRFTPFAIEAARLASGPLQFASQMMLQPVSAADGRLDPDRLMFYTGEIARDNITNKVVVGGMEMRHRAGWWDPALGTEGGDKSVFAIAFADGKGHFYLQRVVYLPTSGNEQDTLSRQCAEIARLAQHFMVTKIVVEANGIGGFAIGRLRAMMKGGYACTLEERHARRAKDERILAAFDALLAARALFVHEAVRITPFMSEMREWQPGRKSQRDDGLDAAAGALSLLPRTIGGLIGGKQYQVKMDWEV